MSPFTLSPDFDEKVRRVYNMPDICALERVAVEMYEDSPDDYQELRRILETRRNLLNDNFIYDNESAKFVQHFNDLLSNVIIKAQKRCNDDLQRLLADCPERNPDVSIYIGLGEIPECHPYKNWARNKWGETVWDIITDADVEELWDRWNDSFITIRASESPIDELDLLGLSDENDSWAGTCHLPKEWTGGMRITMQFHQLYSHSYMSLYDFMFVDKFQIELSHKITYSKNEMHI